MRKEIGENAMTDQHRFVSAGHFDEDLYANSRTGERVLNAAIVQADISLSFEDYLEIFNTFYADDIEVSSGTRKLRRSTRTRSFPRIDSSAVSLLTSISSA